MATDFSGREPDVSPTDAEGVMFGATPVWERNRKKKGFGLGGRKVAAAALPAGDPRPIETHVAETLTPPEPRSFSPPEASMAEPDMTLDRPIDRPATTTNSTLAHPTAAYTTTPASPTLDEEPMMVAPISRTRTVKERNAGRGSPAMIAAGIVALGAVGAVGWYASRPHDGVPELAPGQVDTTEVAAAPVVAAPTPAPAPTRMAANTAEPSRAAPARRAPVARTRPAAAADASAIGTNASTILPDGPRPYSTLNPGAPPPPVVPPAPPVQAAPSPVPEAIPETPPTAPEVAPTPPTPDPTPAPPAVPPQS